LKKLLKNNGYLGFITPNTWELIFSAAQFRKFILSKFCIDEIVHFTQKVFKSATVDCEIVIIQNLERPEHKVLVTVQSVTKAFQKEILQSLWQSLNGDPFNILLTEKEHALLTKIKSESVSVHDISRLKNGVKPFEVGKGNPPQTREIVQTKPYVSKIKKDETFRPLLRGGLIHRYVNYWDDNYWISYGPWLAAPRDPKIFEAREKVICRQTGDRIICTLIDNKFVCRNNLHIILPLDGGYSLKYILGVLNSSFCDFCYRAINPEKGEALAEIKKQHLGQLPIRTINFDDPVENAQHDKLVALVENMLDLQKKYHAAKMERDKELYERQIKIVDAQIDKRVYELYGLTEEEVKVVEGSI
jgi:adenine-specific DNA-methyltransferase